MALAANFLFLCPRGLRKCKLMLRTYFRAECESKKREKSLKNSCAGSIINSLPFAANLSSAFYFPPFIRFIDACFIVKVSFLLLIYIRRHSHSHFSSLFPLPLLPRTATAHVVESMVVRQSHEVIHEKTLKSSQVISGGEKVCLWASAFPKCQNYDCYAIKVKFDNASNAHNKYKCDDITFPFRSHLERRPPASAKPAKFLTHIQHAD